MKKRNCNKLHCVPPSPEVMAQLYADYQRITHGQGITFNQYLISIGYSNPADDMIGMDDAVMVRNIGDNGPELISIPEQPIQGQLNVKVLLIDFPNKPGSLPVSHYQQLLFSKNSYPTGSMRDYFREVTLGKVDVVGSVHGWLRMPNEYEFYSNGESGTVWQSYPRNAPRMAEDAVKAALEAGVEFGSELDVLNQGTITALFIIHAGLGAETSSPSIRGNHIWSHKWRMRNPINLGGNLYASTYLTVPNDCKVGVCAHELGHLAFQWEDFYDPNYDQDGKEWDGSGSWDLMAGGSYNGNGNRPAHPAGLHKTQHHWVDVTEVTESGEFTLEPFKENSGGVLKIVSPKFRSGQYLLLENRAKQGFDSDLPGEGLLVWKVDESADMFTPDNAALTLVQADGRRQLQTPNDWNTGDAGDPFPGSSNRTELSDRGTISTSFQDGDDSGITLRNIQRNPDSGNITLNIGLGDDKESSSDLIEKNTQPNASIPDNREKGVESNIVIDNEGMIRQIAVTLDISHTYIGDLRLELKSPSGHTINLHNRAGGNSDNLLKTYSSSTNGALAELIGEQSNGTWILSVSDLAGADIGTLNSWGLSIEIDRADSTIRADAKPNLAIPDDDPTGISSIIRIPRAGTARNLKVSVDIDHTYIGDLRVELINPIGQRAILHNQTGAGNNALKQTYDPITTDVLTGLLGQSVKGDWTLRVSDLVGNDVGTLNAWSLEIDLGKSASKVEKENSIPKDIPDDNAAGIGSNVFFEEQGTVQSLEVNVDISHTYIGDLRVDLISPSGQSANLHNRTGGRTKDLNLNTTSADSLELSNLVGERLQGNWVLRVADLEGYDTGTLNRWSLIINYAEQ